MANPKIEVNASETLTNSLNTLTSLKHEAIATTLVSFLTENLQSHVRDRQTYFADLEVYENNYIVAGIYDILSNDVLVDTTTNDTIQVSVPDNQKAEEACQKLFERLNITSVLQSILHPLLHYGSYTLRPVVKQGRGVIDLIDDYMPGQVIALTDSKNQPVMFFVSNQATLNNFYQTREGITQNSTRFQKAGPLFEFKPISELIHFSLDLNFVKLVLPENETQSIASKVPPEIKHLMPKSLRIKTSQSFIYPVLDKLKEVLLLDKLAVYKSIGDILTPSMIGVPVPNGYDPSQVIDLIKRYDELLNSNVQRNLSLTNVEAVLREMGAVKAVPIVGDRSNLATIDVGRDISANTQGYTEATEASLGRLLSALAIKKEAFGGEANDSIKTDVRYAKKVKRIQKNLTRPLTWLCLLHLSEVLPDINLKESDIHISLKNNLNLDELENLETLDLMTSSVQSQKTLLEDLAEFTQGTDYKLDRNAALELFLSGLQSAGSSLHTCFIKTENSEGEPDEQTSTTKTESSGSEEANESE